jgi:plastocyanin
MSNTKRPKLILGFSLLLLTLSLSIFSFQQSLTYVYGKSENGSNDGSNDGGGGGSNGNGKHNGSDNGKGKGGGGSNDGGGGSNDGGGGSNDGGGGSNDGGGGSSDGGGGSNDGGGGSNGNNDGGGSNGNSGSDPKNKGPDKNNGDTFLSQILDQTVKDKYGSKVFYVSINDTNNKTNFVPDKVTLTSGSTVVWINKDNSDHTITLESKSKSDYPLLNSLILPNGMVDHKFLSAGTYSYSDLDSPKSKGIITILGNTEKQGAIPESPKD